MMLPGITASPPNFLTPRRRPAVSRPLREEPPAFLCAIGSSPYSWSTFGAAFLAAAFFSVAGLSPASAAAFFGAAFLAGALALAAGASSAAGAAFLAAAFFGAAFAAGASVTAAVPAAAAARFSPRALAISSTWVVGFAPPVRI